MEKVSEDLLLLCRNLQANGAQFFWDTLYIITILKYFFILWKFSGQYSCGNCERLKNSCTISRKWPKTHHQMHLEIKEM